MRELPADGPIWAVTMVRDEEDIIEETILHLLEQGVDHVLVADNLSIDGTRSILETLARRHPVHVTSDPIQAYWQGDKMSLLARAATRFGASWIVPFDADELWYGIDGTVRETLHRTTTPIAIAESFNYVPIDEGGPTYAQRFPYRLADASLRRKVAFRANWLARIKFGNHDVWLPDVTASRQLRIAHYRWRSVEQVQHKAEVATTAVVASRLGSNVEHWFRIARGDTTAAQERDELVQRSDLVFDPSIAWPRTPGR